MNPINLVLDTNILLHYLQLTQIDWRSFVDSDQVRLVIVRTVMKELEKCKVNDTSQRLREAADSALRMLGDFADNSKPTTIRDGVEVIFKSDGPLLDLAEHRLSKGISDDEILAHAIEFSAEHPDDDTGIVTADITFKLNARNHGFKVINIPDKYRRPDQPHPNEKRIKQLERELQEARFRAPVLRLAFADGSDYMVIKPCRFAAASESDIANAMSSMKEQLPVITSVPADITIRDDSATIMSLPIPLPQETIVMTAGVSNEYARRIIEYYEDYKNYLIEDSKYRELDGRTFLLKMELKNAGTTPADDVDVFLQMPDNFHVLSEQARMKPPRKPKPPDATNLRSRIESEGGYSLRTPAYEVLKNVSDPRIDLGEETYKIEFHVRKIKHNQFENISFLVRYFSYDEMPPFTIGYRIHAGNIPEEIAGSLHVKVEK